MCKFRLLFLFRLHLCNSFKNTYRKETLPRVIPKLFFFKEHSPETLVSSLDAVMLQVSSEKGSVIVKTASKMKEVMSSDADRRKSRLLENSQNLSSILLRYHNACKPKTWIQTQWHCYNATPHFVDYKPWVIDLFVRIQQHYSLDVS